MPKMTSAPDVSTLDVPMDQWLEPLRAATAIGELRLPAYCNCNSHRWPPGPFCPQCRSQYVVWNPAGPGRIYSFTILRSITTSGRDQVHVPAPVEFPGSCDIRLGAAIVDTDVDQIRIGAEVPLDWSHSANVMIPVFRETKSRREAP